MNLEINKELVLSTAHIPEETANDLRNCLVAKNIEEYEYGSRVWVDASIPVKHKELIALVKLAKDHDCKWLVLDCDAEVIQELPQFEW